MKIFLFFVCFIIWKTSAQTRSRPCLDPDNKSGRCIFLDECPSVKALFQQKPMTIANRAFIIKSSCGHQNQKSLVCCGTQSADRPLKNQRPSNELPEPGICGFSLQDKIYGGKETQITDYPWMALLQHTKPDGIKGFDCGGSLINDQYVLTAAHCKTHIPANWTLTGVRLGEWDLRTDIDCDNSDLDNPICSPPHKDIEISEIILYADYESASQNQYHDIALLRLKEKVTYSKYISPICLPVHTNLRNRDHVGVVMEVAGWGKTETSQTSNIKLKVKITGVSLERCNIAYRSRGYQLENWQVCAGGIQGQDSCNGDSGGPLMAIDDFTNPSLPYFYMAGLVSFGPSPCGQEGMPGVYTNISPHIDWIKSKLKV